MKLFLLAGEPSGDRLGGALMAGLRALSPGAVFDGVGGADMAQQGLRSRFAMDELSVMGIVEVLRAWPRLDADANVEAWLVTIAHRKAIDLVRKAARSTPTEHVPDRPARHGNPHDHDPDLWAALATLTDRQRQAVAYHHLAGLPHAEVAIILGSTPAATRRACADGIAALRRTYPLLADDDRDEDPR